MERGRYSPYEFALVIAIAFGYSILGSVGAFMVGRTVGAAGAVDAFTSSHLYQVVVYELIAFPVIAAILYARGWRPTDLPLGISAGTTMLGAGVFAVMWMAGYLVNGAAAVLFDSLAPELERLDAYRPSSPPDFVAIYILSLVNPVFEEVIVCGYVIVAVSARFGTTAAVNTSVVIRGLYHLYQGMAVLPFHLLYGLVQAYLFVRFGRLWPLIVSHALLDFVGLLYLI